MASLWIVTFYFLLWAHQQQQQQSFVSKRDIPIFKVCMNVVSFLEASQTNQWLVTVAKICS